MNEAITHAFAHHEGLAVRAKRDYVWAGRFALTSIFIGMSIFAYQLTLGHIWSAPDFMTVAGVVILALGAIAQVLLLAAGTKQKWLYNRFAAERIRCLKFHAFSLVDTVAITQLAAHVSSFYDAGLARLAQELAGGGSAIMDFDPKRVELVDLPPGAAVWAESDRLDAIALYDSLRIGVQLQHCKGQVAEAEDRRRAPLVLGDLLFVVGVALGLADLAWLTIQTLFSEVAELRALTALVHFSTLSIFIASAITSVYHRASTDSADIDRYREYVQDLEGLRGRLMDRGPSEFREVISRVERSALAELRGFVRDAGRSSFIL